MKMPRGKRKSEAKKGGAKHLGCLGHPSVDSRQAQMESDGNPTEKRSNFGEDEIFFDAIEDPNRYGSGCRASAGAPSVDRTESYDGIGETVSTSRVMKLEKDVTRSTPYFPKYCLRINRYSVSTQTTPVDGEGETQNRVATLQWEGVYPEYEMETSLHTENFSSESDDGEYKDARENWTDDVRVVQQGSLKRERPRVWPRSCKNQKVQVSFPKEAHKQKSGLRNRHNEEFESEGLPRQQTTADPVQVEHERPSCCAYLLLIIYWLVVVLFISFLLSLFLTIFLLFSRNHGLGIGPAFLYSDVDLIRNQVNPYLDLRHTGPPPT